MDTGTILIGLAGLALLYVLFSPDPFASALRAKIPFLQRKAADAVDRVDSRVEAAKAAQRGTVRKGRMSLYELQTMLAESKVDLDRVNGEIEDDQKAMALARKNEDRDAFNTLVAEYNRDVAYRDQLLASHEQLIGQLKTLEVGVDEQRSKEKEIEMQGRVMVAQARVNDMVTSVNEALAGLTDNGADNQMSEAKKILDRTTARANASKAAAEGLTPNERAEKKAAAYIKQAKSGGNAGVNADDLWNQMGAAKTSAAK